MDSDGPSTVALTIDAAAWPAALPDLERRCARLVAATLSRAGGPDWLDRAEVSLLLTDDAAIQALNAAWRGQDRPTNVLSFPALDLAAAELPPAGPVLLGDIVLSLGTLEREAAEQGKPLADHFDHLLVHGLLHLLGHDHETDEDAAAMEALEVALLAAQGVADPYAAQPPVAEVGR
jgi:probable rRNA maturation factor